MEQNQAAQQFYGNTTVRKQPVWLPSSDKQICPTSTMLQKKSTMFAARKHRRAFGLVRGILTQKSFSGLCTASTSVSVKHYSSSLERIPPEFHV